MKSYTLNILWTGLADATPHQRKRVISVVVPVEDDATAIQDALLSLPWTPDASYGESRTVRLTDPVDVLTNEVVLVIVIPQARAEMEAETQKEAERKEAQRVEQRVTLATFACGGDDPGYPLTERRTIDWLVSALHHNLAKVAVEHVVVSHGVEAMEGHDELRVQVEARMEMINAGARERAEAELAEKETAQTERERRNAEKEAAKLANAEKRTSEIAAWAVEHGSERLKEQIKQGLDGWPLYLHERLEADFGDDAELDNDGETGDALVNPTEAQLDIARQVAVKAIERGLYLSREEAFEQIEIVPITFKIDEDDCCEYNGELETRVYVTFSGYRPGSEAFELKTIRFCCGE